MTDLNASALDEGLLPVLPQLSAKHQVIVAAVTDPRVDQLAAGRSDAAAVYDAAAAERSRNDRSSDRVAAAPQRGGRDRRAAHRARARACRPLPGDESHRAALAHAGWDHVGRVGDVAGLARPHRASAEVHDVGQKARLGEDSDADPQRMSATATG